MDNFQKTKLKEIVKNHETYKTSEFMNKHIYGTELKEFIGTNLKRVHINDKYHADLMGIEIKPASEYGSESILFYVNYYFDGTFNKVVNQQYFDFIEDFKLFDGELFITIKV